MDDEWLIIGKSTNRTPCNDDKMIKHLTLSLQVFFKSSDGISNIAKEINTKFKDVVLCADTMYAVSTDVLKFVRNKTIFHDRGKFFFEEVTVSLLDCMIPFICDDSINQVRDWIRKDCIVFLER